MAFLQLARIFWSWPLAATDLVHIYVPYRYGASNSAPTHHIMGSKAVYSADLSMSFLCYLLISAVCVIIFSMSDLLFLFSSVPFLLHSCGDRKAKRAFCNRLLIRLQCLQCMQIHSFTLSGTRIMDNTDRMWDHIMNWSDCSALYRFQLCNCLEVAHGRSVFSYDIWRLAKPKGP